MRISALNNQPQYNRLAFQRQLDPAEEKELRQATAEAKQLLGNVGNSVLVVSDQVLPQDKGANTGVGNLLSQTSQEFFDFAKTYFGINTVEVLPQGEFSKKHRSGLVCNYGYSSLGLNESLIDLETLSNGLVTKEEIASVVQENNIVGRDRVVNFENINGKNSAFSKVLHNAYLRFKRLDADDLLVQDFENFRGANSDWLIPKAIYGILKHDNTDSDFKYWHSDLDKNLYSETQPKNLREQRINQLLSENADEVEFYEFKQFLAEKHLGLAREKMREKGLKLFGDMPISFSRDEIWANPQAFLPDFHIGANDWKAPCLDYEHLAVEGSPSNTLLMKKVELMARRYDGIRFDASWLYIRPNITNNSTNVTSHVYYGDRILSLMEAKIKSVQGQNFSSENIIHEFKAGTDDFSMFNHGVLRSEVAKRVVILESENLNSNWGHLDAYSSRFENFIFGVGDHTAQPLVQMAEGVRDVVTYDGLPRDRKSLQLPVLSDIFSDVVENLQVASNFIRAKFADIMGAKHNFIFYMDAFGRSARFDSQGLNGYDNYRYKIPLNYKEEYQAMLQKGHALNLPDVLAKAMEKNGLALTNKNLYEKLCKFAEILREKENKSLQTNPEIKSSGFSKTKLFAVLAPVVLLLGLGGVFIYKKNKPED